MSTILKALSNFTADITTLGCDGDIEIVFPSHFFDKILYEMSELGTKDLGWGMGIIELNSYNGRCVIKRGKK